MQYPIHELEAYFAGDYTDAQLRVIEAWINADKDHAQDFIQQLHFRELVGRHLREQSGDNRAILAELVRLEAAQDADIVTIVNLEHTLFQKNKGLVSRSDLKIVGGYLLRHTLTRRRLVRGALAAAVLMALTIFIALQGSNNQPRNIPTDIAQLPLDAPRPGIHVATLSAEHDAQWQAASGTQLPGVGDALAAGRRLNLTRGFAEITTKRGAVAILQAPATIELLNDNAIHLHTGKLVGICETQSSKGFVVRTPHLDITDLGTRFGVDANPDATDIHVFKGEVQAALPDAPADVEPMTLVASQSARTLAYTDVITRIDHDVKPFAALLPTTIQLPGTGQGLSVGQIDSTWQIVAIDSQKLDGPLSPLVTDAEAYVKSFPNDPVTSQWLAWDTTDASTIDAPVIYHFQREFDLPEDIDPANTRLRLRYMADNAFAAVVINGHRVEILSPIAAKKFDTWLEAVINEHLVAGKNTIVCEVMDSPPTGSGNLVGLRLTWQLETIAYRLENTPSP